MRKTSVLSLIIIIFAFTLGTYLFRQMPAQMATHWGITGEPNGYSSRAVGTFAIPVLMAIMWIAFKAAPVIDPKRKNITSFQPAIDRFLLFIIMFLEYLYLITLAWNLGHRFDFLRFVLPVIALVYFAVADLLKEAKPNWTIGVRSPWTLSSEKVWNKTNKVASTLFRYSAVMALFTLFFPGYSLYLIVAPAIATAIITVAYSYILYRKGE